ncbi:hypothetical protein EB118_02735 [bacterium]|nr:hypothetical protein [Actinomycetota bacterium]NDG28999.1 hypothetical protein [bacterium]
MKLVSVDVGIRNLAVCVLEGTSRHDVKIIGWDVIDVIGEKNGVSRPACFKCKKPAMWTSGELFSCTKHCPKSETITKTALNKKSIGELQELARSYGVTGKKKPELVNGIYAHLKTGGWTKFKGNVKFGGGVLELIPDIIKSLDARCHFWNGADMCIFENQLDRRMFAVQSMLQMYFSCRGFQTSGISAIHKLENILTIDDRTDSYRGRKKTGIVHCEALCPPCNLDFFQSHRKKDDLADCFLQGIWYMEHASAR